MKWLVGKQEAATIFTKTVDVPIIFELTQKGGPLSTLRAFQLRLFQDYYYAMHFLEQMID